MTDTTSIAMATYGGASHLSAQLESFANQTRLPDELVVCDDCSTDNSIEILEAFRSHAPFPVRIFRNEQNLGYRRNFEKALRLCTGEIVFLSDQDDVWFAEKIARVSAEFERQPRLMVVMNDHIITGANLDRTRRTELGNIARLGLPQSHMVTGCCSAHRKEWQDIVLPIPDEVLSHDIWINGIAHDLGVSTIVAEPLQLHRRHSANASNTMFSARRGLFVRRVRRALRLRGGVGIMTRTLLFQEVKLRWYDSRMARLRSTGLGEIAEARRQKLKQECDAQQERLDAIGQPGLARAASIWRLWRSGKYRAASRWRTAIKDLLRS